jgi:hypothetical protein
MLERMAMENDSELQSESETRKRDEYWGSLVAQLRSSLALMEANGELEQAKLDEPLLNELTASAKGGYLSVWLHPDTGEGSWNQITGDMDMAEPWFMSPDGQIELSGERITLSEAVKQFAEKLVTK